MSEQTALTTVDRAETHMIPVSGIDDIKALGKILGESGMFGCKTEAEAVMVAAMCHQDGVSYSKWMDTNHMIQGKKSKRSDAIHADFLRSGGKSKIVKRDPDACIIILTSRDGNEYEFSLTWGDALKEPFVYNGRESDVVNALVNKKTDALKIKDKYQTPRSRMQMLWARCISDSVRAVDPTCCQGVYTPEETEDLVDATTVNTHVSMEDLQQRVAAQAKAKEPEAKPPTPKPAAKKKEDFSAAEVVESAVVNDDVRTKAKEAAQAKLTAQREAAELAKAKTVEAEPAVNAVEPTPFDEPVNNESVDYSVCPIEGRLLGKPWNGMSRDTLIFAKQKYANALTPQHIAAIDEQITAKS